ncbi:MAG TPA: NapC/NirT family cytochrome c, partial [Thermoanaerobaculales bacterium]|nr:NapC/NirT family cytochrome c [Thermoanaerobaculales bacterium]
MLRSYVDFVRAVSIDRLGRLGVVLTTSSFASFVVLQLAMLAGIVTNAYVGLIVYMLFPVLFVVGLLIIPVAWYRQRRRTGLSTRQLVEARFGPDAVAGSVAGARVFRTVALLTLANLLILGGASIKMLHFMDSPRFCGTACHQVMSPEWTTYQASPHARVACVECHVGEGMGALLNSKLNGAWQIVSATFDLYERPIPTPVLQLRPARETCERCHWPEKFYGNRLTTRIRYDNDEASTPHYTTLNLKIDAGAAGSTGVHWHVARGV